MADGESDVDYANLIRAQTRQVDIDAFKERGMKKVNVINAKKINELISQAVTNIIGRMESADIQTIKDDKAQIVMDSMAEFKRLFAEQKKEAEGQGKLQEEIESLRDMLAQRESSGPAASSLQTQQISDEIAELKAFMINQASRAQSGEMTRAAMMEQQANLLEDHFNELKAALATGGNVAAQQAVADDNTKKALEEAVDKMASLLEQQEKNRNGATTDALMQAFKELRGDLDKKFTDLTSAIKESSQNISEGVAKANSEGLKAEIAALRADLEAKTVAAAGANTEALQAQLAKMEEMMAKGGGGGAIGAADMGELISKLEGSMNKKFAEAGIGKEEVSMDDAVAVSGVMLGAAFKGMDDIESNIGSLDAKKTKDAEGGKKAKGALDALKKLKGKG
ncbi:MAG: hypothetical protein KF696_07890 [Planctomycetes bacterium]|nr:hypothetical protein [Planctomycetota bacterium]MCW8135474.1 hypothetical protein [Planctomycetota bacterium]